MFEKAKYIFRPSNALLYFGIALLFQIFYLITFKSFDSPGTQELYFLKGDGYQYIDYCENLYKYGSYFEGKNGIPSSYVCRMPGMCVIYNPLRLLFSQQTTLNLFVLCQALFAAIASYVIALIAKKIFKSNISFYLSFILYATSTIIANNNHRLYAESLAISTFVFAFYYFFKYLELYKLRHLLICSLFLIWCVFLRPFIAPFIVFASLYLFYILLKRRILLKHFLIFIVPVFICFGSWTYRNYKVTNYFIPLQVTWDGVKTTESLENFIETFGLNWVWWDTNSEHTWFNTDKTISFFHIKRPPDSIFDTWYSKHIFTKELTIDTLKKARFYYWQSINDSLSEKERDLYRIKSANILNHFVDEQRENHPLLYYIGYRTKILLCFLDHPLGAGVYSYKYPCNIAVTFLDAIANAIIFKFGPLFLLMLLGVKRYRTLEVIAIISVPLFILGLFAFYYRTFEGRLVALAIPFFILCGSQSIVYLCEQRHKYIYIGIISLYLLYTGVYAVIHYIHW